MPFILSHNIALGSHFRLPERSILLYFTVETFEDFNFLRTWVFLIFRDLLFKFTATSDVMIRYAYDLLK